MTPIKVIRQSGDTVGLGEFGELDAVAIIDGGTGATTAEGARTNLGVVTTLDGLTDVTITTPASGESLVYNGTAWVNEIVTAGQAYTESDTAPLSPNIGDEWLDTTEGVLYKYVSDGVDFAWVDINGLGASITDWGEIGGTLSNQTDLATALDGKVAKVTSTDNAIVRFDGTTGAVQDSGLSIDDTKHLSFDQTTNTLKAGSIFYHETVGLTLQGVTGQVFDFSIYSQNETAMIANPTGTSNIVVNGTTFQNASGNVGIGGDPANGLVGGLTIGNGTDNKGITLFGSATSQQNIAFTDTANNQQGLIQYDHNTNSFRFFTSSAERMKIDSAGNVGMGVTPSATNTNSRSLEVNSLYLNSFNYTTQASSSYIGNNYYYDVAGFKYKTTGSGAVMMEFGYLGNYIWYTAPSGTAGDAITWVESMKIINSAQCILNGGYASGITAGFIAYGTASNTYTEIVARNTSDTNDVFSSAIAGVLKSAILANGSFQSATNSYGSTSDVKLKENIVDATPKLEKLMQVKVRNFNYIGEDVKQLGVVAQEIEEIFPNIVYETNDTAQVEVTKTRTIPAVDAVIDEDGNVVSEAQPEKTEEYTEIETQETGETTKNVKYSVLYMMMLKGMQEQQEIINSLKSRIEALENV
jgi:hypothetical protein